MRTATVVLACVVGAALAGDPSTTWEAFAVYTPAHDAHPHPHPHAHGQAAPNITSVSATYVVPTNPIADDGSTPKWWVGLQSADGNGVLMKPQLTWSNSSWGISTEVLDYSVTPNVKIVSKVIAVAAGDVIDASVTSADRTGASGTYRLSIGKQQGGGGASASVQTYTVRTASEPQTRAYAVMEHQPKNCSELPASGKFTFHDVQVGVGGNPGDTNLWVAKQHLPVCGARSTAADRTIMFSWDASARRQRANVV